MQDRQKQDRAVEGGAAQERMGIADGTKALIVVLAVVGTAAFFGACSYVVLVACITVWAYVQLCLAMGLR
jgi:hypothetical protein